VADGMNRENGRNLDDHIVAATLAFVIAFIVGAKLFGYDLPGGILSPLLQ
jgi:hypothetical protein